MLNFVCFAEGSDEEQTGSARTQEDFVSIRSQHC